MFEEIDLILFLTASLVVIVAPGPDNILVLTRGVTLGRRAALVSAAGASVGLVCHSLFAAAACRRSWRGRQWRSPSSSTWGPRT